MKHTIRGSHKTHRSHVSGSRRAIRFAARRKDDLVRQAARLERALKRKEPQEQPEGPTAKGESS